MDYISFDGSNFRGVRLLADRAEVQPGVCPHQARSDMLLKLTAGHPERYMRVISNQFFVRLDAFHKLTFVPRFATRSKDRLERLVVLYRGVILEKMHPYAEIEGGLEAFNQVVDRLWPAKRISVGSYPLDIRVPPLITHIEARRHPSETWIHFGKNESTLVQLPGECSIIALVKLFNKFRDVPLVAIDSVRAVSADVSVRAFRELYLDHDGILPEEHDCPGIDECGYRWSCVRVMLGADSYSFIVRDCDSDDLDLPYEATKHYAMTKRVAEQTERKIKAKQHEALEAIRWGFARAIEGALPIDLAYEVSRMLL